MIIIDSESNPGRLQNLQTLLAKEWGDFDLFKGATEKIDVPFPLLAVDGDNLLGGIAFSRYKSPIDDQISLWVNGLVVKPEYRLRGIGSCLIRAAEVKLKEKGFETLFALTDIPKLYEKLGWCVVSISKRDSVVKKSL